MIKEEYDPGTKIWTTVLAIFVMVAVQWPSVIAPRLAHPPRHPSELWNAIALAIGFSVPIAWLVGDLKRLRIGLSWVLTIVALAIWAVVSTILASN